MGMHPSHSPLCGLVGEDETELLEGAKSAQILLMPAGDDHENVRPGGLAEKVRDIILTSRTYFLLFPL